jgi:hypothetical protein
MGSVERVPRRSVPLDQLSHRDAAVGVWLVEVDSPDWRGLTRPSARILGLCLGSRPSKVRFRYGFNRKPRLTHPIDRRT